VNSPRASLHSIADRAADFLESLATRRVSATATTEELLRRLYRPLPEQGTPAEFVIQELIEAIEPGLVASAGPRFFGYVVGGATHASLMADWLTSAWDQNAQTYSTSPAAATAEVVVARWLLELFDLPAHSSVGFVTGGQMANFTALACARNAVLQRAGWDWANRGLFGAPPITALMSDGGHATVRAAFGMLGIGSAQIREIPSDSEGRMQLAALERAVRSASGRPMVLSVQAGNANTGCFEPIDAIAELVRSENAWIHVDGAFGLWAAVSPELKSALRGLELADSWATDAHKWLNVPFDSGIVIVRDPAQHRSLKSDRCAYTDAELVDRRDGSTWTPENSRRARAFVLYAVLRELGRSGVRALIERCCLLARQCAADVARLPGARVANEVVLNQVLVRFASGTWTDSEAFHRAIAARVQAGGECWLGTTVWKGEPAIRISICNWLTTEEDLTSTLRSLEQAVREVAEESSDGVR
jgi:glutamate/tyrosine decarboxylase-like PLP-dependent enzyme